MAPTPQITLRVPPKKLERWKAAAELVDSNVSEIIRARMDEFADDVERKLGGPSLT